MSDNAPKKLTRSRSDRMISGVCGGLASYLNMDASLVRVLAVVLAFVTSGAAVLAYVVIWAVVPEEGTGNLGADKIRETYDANVKPRVDNLFGHAGTGTADQPRTTPTQDPQTSPAPDVEQPATWEQPYQSPESKPGEGQQN